MDTHNIDTHQNQDKVLKEALELYIGKDLDFFTIKERVVTEILSTEFTETTTTKLFTDKMFKLDNNTGLHTEWEAHIGLDDIIRFGIYNLQGSRTHKIPFTTVIITRNKTNIKSYSNSSINFEPIIIELDSYNAEEALEELKAGKHNILKLLYLPLFNSENKNIAELLTSAVEILPNIIEEPKERQKILSLWLLLTSSFVAEDELNKIKEVIMEAYAKTPLFMMIQESGREQGVQQGMQQGIQQGVQQGMQEKQIEIASEMLKQGYDENVISSLLKMPTEWVLELKTQK